VFTQAGITTTGVRLVCFAQVSRWGRSGIVWGWLMRWPSGDMAWCSSTQACWGEQVHIHDMISIPLKNSWGPSWPLEPAAGARHWIEKGVAPDADEWQARRLVRDAQDG
jgi:hypothetical protein